MILFVNDGWKIPSMIFQRTIKQLGVTQKVVLSEMYKLNNFLSNGQKIGQVDQYIAS